MNFIFKILRAPTFHFLLMGSLLFGAKQMGERYFANEHPKVEDEIVIRKSQIEELKDEIKVQTGLEPKALQIQAAIEKAIDDEVLYRQALHLNLDKTNAGVRHRLIQIARFVSNDSSLSDQAAYRKALDLGLDRSDPVVRRQLITQMKLIAAKVPNTRENAKLSAEQIQKFYEENKTKYEKPERVSFTHIYLSRDKRGKQAQIEASRLLKDLQSKQIQPPLQNNLGDLFLMGNLFSNSNFSLVQRYFGSDFATQIFKLERGKWQGPIASTYGWHLVWIDDFKGAQLSPLGEVINQLEGNLLQERESMRLKEALKTMRSHYKIRVENNENSAETSGANPHA